MLYHRVRYISLSDFFKEHSICVKEGVKEAHKHTGHTDAWWSWL
jgi:hypothetical protein